MTLCAPSEARTLPELVHAVARAYGDAPAVVRRSADGRDAVLTFAELERRSGQLARALAALGVGKGVRVGFQCANGPEFAVWLAAIARAGGVAIPLSTLARGPELVRLLRQSDVAGLFVEREVQGKDLLERLVRALPALAGAGREIGLPEVPFLRWVISTGGDLPPGVRTLESVLALAERIPAAVLAEREREITPADQLLEIYTSGSMALPKGVKHNHGPILFRTHFIRSMTPKAVRGAEIPVPLPMFWVGGLMMYLLPNLEAGAVSVCGERLLADSRFAMGSVLAAEDEALVRGEGMSTYWGLGMTETAGPYTWGDEWRAPGYPLCAPMDHVAPGFEVRLADEAGREVAEGEVGEMQVRGYAVTPGIHKVEREALFTPDGYYRTGDLCLRRGGRILFVGRDGDMIKTASANVSPAEVEQELQALPGVHSAYVFGLPDPERGEIVAAALVPREGVELDPDELAAALRERLSPYKVPRAFALFRREEIPVLPSNKVHRKALRQLLAERLGRSL